MICLWNDLTSQLTLNSWTVGPLPMSCEDHSLGKAEDRGKEQELKWKAAEVVICCICLFSTCELSSLTSIKKPGRSCWRWGVTGAAQVGYDPTNSRIRLERVTVGSGELLLWQKLGRETEGSPASEMTENGVHGLRGLCCCSETCQAGSTHAGIHVPCLQGGGGMKLVYSYPVWSHYL